MLRLVADYFHSHLICSNKIWSDLYYSSKRWKNCPCLTLLQWKEISSNNLKIRHDCELPSKRQCSKWLKGDEKIQTKLPQWHVELFEITEDLCCSKYNLHILTNPVTGIIRNLKWGWDTAYSPSWQVLVDILVQDAPLWPYLWPELIL